MQESAIKTLFFVGNKLHAGLNKDEWGKTKSVKLRPFEFVPNLHPSLRDDQQHKLREAFVSYTLNIARINVHAWSTFQHCFNCTKSI